MGDFIKNNPFRFWCQKVLPLVYDDSLSYYELLCKVVGKLNELAENQNNLSDEIKEVAKDLNDFKNQVPGMVEAKVEEWLNNYIATHGLVNSVNGMTGEVTLTAADVGAIANVNGSVKNNNIADGAVTAEKLANGVIPEKLPNPQKLTFTGAVTGEYDGSQAVNIDIPAGGGGGGGNAPLTFTGAVDATYNGTEAVTVNIPQGGGAVDSVNGMIGAVVLKKLTANEGLTMSGGDGYNGSAEQTVGIAAGGVTNDKIASGAVTAEKIASKSVTADKLADGTMIPTWRQSFIRDLGGVKQALSIVIARSGYITAVSFSTGDKKVTIADTTIGVQFPDQSIDMIPCFGINGVYEPKTRKYLGTIECKLSEEGGVGKVGTFKYTRANGLSGEYEFLASVVLLPL